MLRDGCVFLMYHELALPNRECCQSDPGYIRYVLSAEEFESQMLAVRDHGMRGVSVSHGLLHPESAVVITFDDGCETDLLTAAPVLTKLGFGGTFYVVAGKVGKPGFMRGAQLRELSGAGFEIGCHSMTHPYLPDLDEAGLQREIAAAKVELERILGKAIEHFSCPGGRYDSRVIRIAKAAGYRTLATSVPRANSPSSDPFHLGRIAITRGMSNPSFLNLCRGNALWKLQLKVGLNDSAKRLLGNTAYDRLRSLILKK